MFSMSDGHSISNQNHTDGGPRSAGWRDHGGRRKFEFDFRDSEGPRREDDRDGLPEWCTDEEDGEMGTFDSSGAFMCIKVCVLAGRHYFFMFVYVCVCMLLMSILSLMLVQAERLQGHHHRRGSGV